MTENIASYPWLVNQEKFSALLERRGEPIRTFEEFFDTITYLDGKIESESELEALAKDVSNLLKLTPNKSSKITVNSTVLEVSRYLIYALAIEHLYWFEYSFNPEDLISNYTKLIYNPGPDLGIDQVDLLQLYLKMRELNLVDDLLDYKSTGTVGHLLWQIALFSSSVMGVNLVGSYKEKGMSVDEIKEIVFSTESNYALDLFEGTETK